MEPQGTGHPGTRIGHVHLKVTDLDRAVAFYRDVIGLEVTQTYGREAAFLSFGGYHHHIALNTWQSKDGPQADPRAPGLFHTAFLVPDRVALGQALKRVMDHGIALQGAADHGVSEAIYLADPDGNGIEIYRDRPAEDWPRKPDGSLRMTNAPLDLEALLAEADIPARDIA